MIDDFSYHQIFGSAISNLFFSTNYIVGENALHKLFTGAKLNELKKNYRTFYRTYQPHLNFHSSSLILYNVCADRDSFISAT